MIKGIPKPAAGEIRQWVKCKECNDVGFYDFVPHTLSTKALLSNCGHGIGSNNWYLRINEREARTLLQNIDKKRTYQEMDAAYGARIIAQEGQRVRFQYGKSTQQFLECHLERKELRIYSPGGLIAVYPEVTNVVRIGIYERFGK